MGCFQKQSVPNTLPFHASRIMPWIAKKKAKGSKRRKPLERIMHVKSQILWLALIE
jgi:hypothetical protein